MFLDCGIVTNKTGSSILMTPGVSCWISLNNYKSADCSIHSGTIPAIQRIMLSFRKECFSKPILLIITTYLKTRQAEWETMTKVSGKEN